MDIWKKTTNEIVNIFSMFFDAIPISYQDINTSMGDSDFRETIIVETESGNKWVVKLADNDFTSPEKIRMWQRTVLEYLNLGYYCPKIYCDKTGGYPTVEYKGHKCVAYAEEFAVFTPVEDRNANESNYDRSVYEQYRKNLWCMTAKVAARHFDYTEYPSGYCLFETFCPSDKVDEVLENALKWKDYADTLPEEYSEQVQRIWKLWIENRSMLEPIYKDLPTSVFQADLNASNILIDDSKKFVGIYDFNLCGKDVFLNYLMRENDDFDFEREIRLICDMLKVSSEYYSFSEIEKKAALMLYRCLKPLWFSLKERLKDQADRDEIKALLDKTEHYLTANIDFKSYME